MNLRYTMAMIVGENGEYEDVYLPQEQLKYIFEHMEIGTHVWTTDNYSRTGKVTYKDFRGDACHMIISLLATDSKKPYF